MADLLVKKSSRRRRADATEETTQNEAHHWPTLSIPRVCLLSGCFDVAVNTFTYPLWLLKTREQSKPGTSGSTFQTFQVARFVLREHGVQGLYRGGVSGIFGMVPAHCAFLLSYEWSKHELGRWLPHSCVPAVAAAVSEISFVALANPVEVATVRMQCMENRTSRGAAEFRDLWRTGGIRRLYSGAGITLTSSLPQAAVWWVTYENCKALFSRSTTSNSASIYCGSSMVASLLSTLFTNPLDVLKTRVQLTGKGGLAVIGHGEPLRALFMQGLGPRLLSAINGGLLEAVTYEAIMHYSKVR